LSKAAHLDLLQVDVDEVIVPDKVIDEIRAYGASDLTVQAIQQSAWLKVCPTPTIPRAIEALRRSGMYLTDEFTERILAQVGE